MKYLGLASASELAIAVMLTASTYAQVAGPSPRLNLPGATEQGEPLPAITVTGRRSASLMGLTGCKGVGGADGRLADGAGSGA